MLIKLVYPLPRRSPDHALDKVPDSQKDGFEAEGEGDGGRGDELLLGVDRRSEEPAVDEAARQAADVGGVAHVRDRRAQEQVDGGQDQELAYERVLERERALPYGEPENAAQE